MGGTLLVSDENVLNAAFGFGAIQFVINGQNRPTGISENMPNAMTL
jgi:hypothetical protein